MTYNITKTNGTIVKELGENIIDFDTISYIGLIGKLSPNYGETQSNNFIHLAENFANATAPENPSPDSVQDFQTEAPSPFANREARRASRTQSVHP